MHLSVFSLLLSGASGRSRGADRRQIRPNQGVPAGGGGAYQGEVAEAEGGKAEAAGGGAHPGHRANQPAGKCGRAASSQTEGGGEPRAAQGQREGECTEMTMVQQENKPRHNLIMTVLRQR